MQTELEAKFLDIDPIELRKKLESNQAVLVHKERLMRRRVFDYPDERLRKIGGWIRVRDEGDKITLSYKQLVERTLEGTKEITVNVNDFVKTTDLLLAIGLDQKSYQETKRERWDLSGVEITIDTWPWIPTFVELEGTNEKQLQEAAKKLGLDWTKALFGPVENAYKAYYNVTDDEIDSWESITFIPIPDWLEIREK